VTELGYGGALLKSLTMSPYGAFFAGGTLLYLVFDRGWTPGRAAGVIAAAVLGQMSAVHSIPGFITGPRLSDEPIVRGLAMACVAAVSLAATWPGTLRKPQRWAAIGALTYPLYLVHSGIGHLLFARWQGAMSPAGAIIPVILLVYLIAWVMARTVERRMVPWLSKRPCMAMLEGARPASETAD
jgi:peptidoglycan/LPS O-acetylase OafA/YrhL